MSRYEFDKYDTLSSVKYHSRQILRALEVYKDHFEANMVKWKKEQPKDKISQFINSEKLAVADKVLEKIKVDNDEIEILMMIDCFCNIMDADRVRTRLQVIRLVKENRWLRTELYDLQKRLMKLEDNVVTAEAEKNHYQLVYKMRNLRRTDEQYSSYEVGIDDDEDTDPEEDVPPKIKPVHNLCMEYIREKRYEVALPLIEKNIQQTKSKLGENNNEVATLYSIMGKIHKEQGNLEEAQEMYEKSLKIREKALGKEHNATGITMTNVAHILFKRNNFKEAEKYGVQALKIREKTLGKTHLDVALLHAHLGTYYINLEKWNDCINHYKIAIGIYEQMFDITDNLIMRGHISMAKAFVKLKQNDKSAEMLALICKSYQQKNSNENSSTLFQFAQNFADGKSSNFTPEFLMKEFGSYDTVIDMEVFHIMIEYFENLKKPAVVETLKTWYDASTKQPTAAVRQSIISRGSKRVSTLMDRKTSSTSQSLKKDKSSIIGFFKKNKKEK